MADVKPKVARALTNPEAFNAADEDTRNECWTHIHDAINQVQDAQGATERKAMLERLPAHIRSIVEEWVKAFWGVEVVYCGSPDMEIRVLPLSGIVALVKKKGA